MNASIFLNNDSTAKADQSKGNVWVHVHPDGEYKVKLTIHADTVEQVDVLITALNAARVLLGKAVR